MPLRLSLSRLGLNVHIVANARLHPLTPLNKYTKHTYIDIHTLPFPPHPLSPILTLVVPALNMHSGGSSGSKRKNIVDSSAPSSRLSAAGGGGGGAQQLLGSGLVERHMTTSDAGAVQLRKKAKASAPNPLSAAKPRDDSRSQRKKKKNKFRASS